MDETVGQIRDAAARLRQVQRETLSRMTQAEVVEAIGEWARRWRQPQNSWRQHAEVLETPFPFAHTRVSLDALLASLSPELLWELIDSESVREAQGPSLIGHVIAGNTPLLAWTSLLRALLLRSASLVKLPSNDASEWARLFVGSLADVSPPLASAIHLAQWPGGTTELDGALCRSVDSLVAYGSDGTIAALRALTPAHTPLLGYGHRVSFGFVRKGAGTDEAARGFARDVLLYDQGGCLSPQTIFVEGDTLAAHDFAERFADALASTARALPLPTRSPQAAMRVREARLLACMAPETQVWEDPALRWTVIARPEAVFALSPTHGVVSVQPLLRLDDLADALGPVAGKLQACALASDISLPAILVGLSRICPPGQLQAPPFSWREDGRDVLRSLLPGGGQDDDRGLGRQRVATDCERR